MIGIGIEQRKDFFGAGKKIALLKLMHQTHQQEDQAHSQKGDQKAQ